MKKEEIIQMLIQNHEAFKLKIETLSDIDFTRSPGSKWSTGQQLDHILKSVAPITKAFSVSPSVLASKYGLSSRPGYNYSDLVSSYQIALKNRPNFPVPERFIPSKIPTENKDSSLNKLMKLIGKLCTRISQYEENALDSHILLHPLLGELTLREMLYFTAYHVKHHDQQILENLNTNPT